MIGIFKNWWNSLTTLQTSALGAAVGISIFIILYLRGVPIGKTYYLVCFSCSVGLLSIHLVSSLVRRIKHGSNTGS